MNTQCANILLNVTLDFNKICRCCLQQNDILISIRDQTKDAGDFLSLSDMLKVFNNILINENDGLPDKVCQQCALVINSAYLFYIKFQQSILALKELVENDAKSIALSLDDNVNLLNSIKDDNLTSIIITNSNANVICEQSCNEGTTDAELSQILNDIVINNSGNIPSNTIDIGNELLVSNYTDNSRKQPIKILPKIFVCNKCDEIFYSKIVFDKHTNDIHPNLCPDCNRIFDNDSELKMHECNKNIFYECDLCSVKYKTQLDLDKHRNIEHYVNKKRYHCSLCPKKFSSKRGRSMHLFQHKKNFGEFTCKLCFMKFTQRLRYIFHKKMHEENVCYYCDHGFVTKDTMLMHVEREHLLRKKFPCIFCKKDFSTKRIMLRHTKLAHSINKIYFCGICNNSKIGYTAFNYLKKHLDKHSMNKNINDIIDDDDDDDVGFDNNIFISSDKSLQSIDRNNTIDDGFQINLFNDTDNVNDFLDINTNNYKLSMESFDNFVNDNTDDEFNVPFITEDNYDNVDNVEILTDILNLKNPLDINVKHDDLFSDFIIEPKDLDNKILSRVTDYDDDLLTNSLDKSDNDSLNETILNIEIDNKNVNRYKCPKCLNYFDKQADMKIHLAHVHDEAVLTCNQCGATFNRTDDIDAHRLEHFKENRKLNTVTDLKTDNQNLDTDDNGTLDYKTIRNGNQINYECCLCDRTFQRKINLQKHKCEFYHDKKLLISCNFCNKTFTTNHAMYMHRKTHLNNSLICSLCDKIFTTVGGLKYHLKTHTGIKAFVCPICDRKFTANINLTAHIRGVHSEIKPHNCSICDRGFATVDRLKKHIKTHSGQKNFECPTCGKSYYQSSHLAQHIRNHTGVKPYKCTLCDAQYFSSASVKKHLQGKHSINQPTQHDYKIIRVFPTDN